MSRTSDRRGHRPYRPALLDPIRSFVDRVLFLDFQELQGRIWSAWMLVWAGLLMAWDDGQSLVARFDSVRQTLRELFPKEPLGSTYQGYIKALLGWGKPLLARLNLHLRQRLRQIAGPYWLREGWCAFAVDGSRVECPRTALNERVLGCAGRNKTGPQLFLTTLYHMGTGCPWAWQVGPGTESERHHLRCMLSLLPPGSLIVADAGFAGYDLLESIRQAGHHFLFRVGRNVSLLRGLGCATVQQGNTVHLWPLAHRNRCPLVLRLIELGKGSKRVFLITDVLEDQRLSDAQAGVLYRMRWGVEVFYRSLKQTLRRHKMRSETPDRAECELTWAVTGLALLSLMSIRQIIARGQDPLSLSVAAALRAVRLAMRKTARCGGRNPLLRQLGRAQKDTYRRAGSKQARNWPHKKTERPPGPPRVLIATLKQVQQAKVLYDKLDAA